MPLLFVDHNLKGESAMHLGTWPATALALLATFASLWAAFASRALAAPPDGLPALDPGQGRDRRGPEETDSGKGVRPDRDELMGCTREA